MSVIRLSNVILLQHSAGNPAEITPAIFLFLKEIASADRAILYTYWRRGFALMDAVVFAAMNDSWGQGTHRLHQDTAKAAVATPALYIYIYMSAYV